MFEALKHILLDDRGGATCAPPRRAPRECDGALTGTTRHWLRRLPARRRPLRLCEEFPRVANRVAWCWSDAALAARTLEDLLQDRRGGRRGFPPPVVRELNRLREYNDHQRMDTQPGGFWSAVGRVVGTD
jgi:hypothetical protein